MVLPAAEGGGLLDATELARWGAAATAAAAGFRAEDTSTCIVTESLVLRRLRTRTMLLLLSEAGEGAG